MKIQDSVSLFCQAFDMTAVNFTISSYKKFREDKNWGVRIL